MDNNNSKGLLIVGVILSALIVIRLTQLILLARHRHCCKPIKKMKFCKDVIIIDEEDEDDDDEDTDKETSKETNIETNKETNKETNIESK